MLRLFACIGVSPTAVAATKRRPQVRVFVSDTQDDSGHAYSICTTNRGVSLRVYRALPTFFKEKTDQLKTQCDCVDNLCTVPFCVVV